MIRQWQDLTLIRQWGSRVGCWQADGLESAMYARVARIGARIAGMGDRPTSRRVLQVLPFHFVNRPILIGLEGLFKRGVGIPPLFSSQSVLFRIPLW